MIPGSNEGRRCKSDREGAGRGSTRLCYGVGYSYKDLFVLEPFEKLHENSSELPSEARKEKAFVCGLQSPVGQSLPNGDGGGEANPPTFLGGTQGTAKQVPLGILENSIKPRGGKQNV